MENSFNSNVSIIDLNCLVLLHFISCMSRSRLFECLLIAERNQNILVLNDGEEFLGKVKVRLISSWLLARDMNDFLYTGLPFLAKDWLALHNISSHTRNIKACLLSMSK